MFEGTVEIAARLAAALRALPADSPQVSLVRTAAGWQGNRAVSGGFTVHVDEDPVRALLGAIVGPLALGASKVPVEPETAPAAPAVRYWHHPESDCYFMTDGAHPADTDPADGALCEELEKGDYDRRLAAQLALLKHGLDEDDLAFLA